VYPALHAYNAGTGNMPRFGALRTLQMNADIAAVGETAGSALRAQVLAHAAERFSSVLTVPVLSVCNAKSPGAKGRCKAMDNSNSTHDLTRSAAIARRRGERGMP
jgi:hypothetical protein